MKPEEELNLKAVKEVELGQQVRAEKAFKVAIVKFPGFAQSYYNLGNLFYVQGKLDQAVRYYKKAIRKDPGFFKTYYNLAYGLQSLGEPAQAVLYYEKYLEYVPRDIAALTNRGVALQDLGQYARAKTGFEKAVSVDENNSTANNNLGALMSNTGDYEGAVRYLKQAVNADKNMAQAYYNLGNVYHLQGKIELAVELYMKSLEINDGYVEAWTSLGRAWEDLGELVAAREAYERAMQVKPDSELALVSALHLARNICDWDKAKRYSARLDRLTKASLRLGRDVGELPFLSIIRKDDPRFNMQVAQARSKVIEKEAMRMGKPEFDNAVRRADKRIRVGYVSNDWHNHAVAHLIKNMFALHDRKAFEVYGYSYGPDDDNKYARLVKAGCDKYVNIANLNFCDAARVINEDKIDILVDLKGHTRDDRLVIFAFRPVPVQVTYLGFPGTLGADFIDYNVVDKVIVPREVRKFYTEKLVVMPDCYQINDDKQELSTKRFSRLECGLPEGGTVFCCFNKTIKIEPMIFNSWMRILSQVEGSVLWLLRSNGLAEENLKKEAEKRGVDEKRLVFADRIDLPLHLARLRLADIALDTRIYNGGATTSNALRSGVPVVTLEGRSYLARMSSSLLTAAGMVETITSSTSEYERVAVWLAKDKIRLPNIKQKPLFDSGIWVSNLERGYKMMWERFVAGKLPATIVL